MYLEFPIAYPVAMLLDKALGHDEGTVYKKAELKTFVSLHQRKSNLSDLALQVLRGLIYRFGERESRPR